MLRIHWFRRDLRLHDNPALNLDAGPVLPVFILDPDQPIGAAARWWLHHSLQSLSQSLGTLLIFRGNPAAILGTLARAHAVGCVSWNRVGEPTAAAQDTAVTQALTAIGVETRSFAANLLAEPEPPPGTGGGPKVFTPFWKRLRGTDIAQPQRTACLPILAARGGMALDDLRLTPTRPNWAAHWTEIWQPGEAGGLSRLDAFVSHGLCGYATKRDIPGAEHVSRLSAHLHWGEVSVRLLWHRILLSGAPADDIEKFLSEVGWRDFAYRLLHHAPDLAQRNWNPTFDRYPWVENPAGFEAWKSGRTGYPLVDAGMRQLWATGWMHNRVRMVAASFLTKHLRIHWSQGMAWFADTLVDADAAVNPASWQWVAGSGADASPYFRIFNPALQAGKFDPDGAYVRRWCPDADTIAPIVDHAAARNHALAGYRQMQADA